MQPQDVERRLLDIVREILKVTRGKGANGLQGLPDNGNFTIDFIGLEEPRRRKSIGGKSEEVGGKARGSC